MVEESLLTGSDEPLNRMVELMHGNIFNYHETSLDYMHANLTDEASLVLKAAIDKGAEESPLTYYYLAYYGTLSQALGYLKKAKPVSPDCCFPNRLEGARIFDALIGKVGRAHV